METNQNISREILEKTLDSFINEPRSIMNKTNEERGHLLSPGNCGGKPSSPKTLGGSELKTLKTPDQMIKSNGGQKRMEILKQDHTEVFKSNKQNPRPVKDYMEKIEKTIKDFDKAQAQKRTSDDKENNLSSEIMNLSTTSMDNQRNSRIKAMMSWNFDDTKKFQTRTVKYDESIRKSVSNPPSASSRRTFVKKTAEDVRIKLKQFFLDFDMETDTFKAPQKPQQIIDDSSKELKKESKTQTLKDKKDDVVEIIENERRSRQQRIKHRKKRNTHVKCMPVTKHYDTDGTCLRSKQPKVMDVQEQKNFILRSRGLFSRVERIKNDPAPSRSGKTTNTVKQTIEKKDRLKELYTPNKRNEDLKGIGTEPKIHSDLLTECTPRLQKHNGEISEGGSHLMLESDSLKGSCSLKKYLPSFEKQESLYTIPLRRYSRKTDVDLSDSSNSIEAPKVYSPSCIQITPSTDSHEHRTWSNNDELSHLNSVRPYERNTSSQKYQNGMLSTVGTKSSMINEKDENETKQPSTRTREESYPVGSIPTKFTNDLESSGVSTSLLKPVSHVSQLNSNAKTYHDVDKYFSEEGIPHLEHIPLELLPRAHQDASKAAGKSTIGSLPVVNNRTFEGKNTSEEILTNLQSTGIHPLKNDEKRSEELVCPRNSEASSVFGDVGSYEDFVKNLLFKVKRTTRNNKRF